MNKFFHKTLQYSVGITGLAIIYLGLSLVPDFMYNLWTFALSHPLSGGLATGLPLIPLLMSSKQKRVLQMTDTIYHSDIDTSSQLVINQNIKHFLSGWIQKVSYTFAYEIPYGQDTTFAMWSYVKDDTGGVYNVDIDDYGLTDILSKQGDAGLSVNRLPVRPLFEHANTNEPGDLISKHTNTQMDWVAPGDVQVVQIAGMGHVDPVGGEVSIRVEVVLIIAAFGAGKSKKQGSAPNFMLISGRIAGAAGETKYTFIPETDLRLFSIRGLWAQTTADEEDFIAIYQGSLDVNDFLKPAGAVTFSDVLLRRRNMFFLGNHADMSSDTTFNEDYYQFTAFKKGPIFMKKATPWTVHVNVESGNDAYISITAQIMPDYQNAVDWNINLTIDTDGTPTDDFTYFVIPYDIYVTQISWDYKFTVLSTETGNTDQEVYLQGIKNGQYQHSTALEGFLQYPNGSTSQDTIRTAALENIYITAPPADVYGGGTGKTTSYSNSGVTQVNDYYPRGSKIGIANTAISTINDFGFMLHIEGVVAKKTGKRDALSYHITKSTMLDIVTSESAS